MINIELQQGVIIAAVNADGGRCSIEQIPNHCNLRGLDDYAMCLIAYQYP